MEQKNFGTAEELYQFVHLALHDVEPPARPDFVYLFGQTADNAERSLDLGAEAGKAGIPVGILDCPPYAGYGGVAAWKDGLLRRGVPGEKIILLRHIPLRGNPAPNTCAEASALVQFAKEHGIRVLLIVAPALHIVRAALTAIRAVLREYPELRVYFRTAALYDWTGGRILHSQGIAEGTRLELLRGEFERLERYCTQGDVASLPEAIRYVVSRDAAS